jgi:hypothetical protein
MQYIVQTIVLLGPMPVFPRHVPMYLITDTCCLSTINKYIYINFLINRNVSVIPYCIYVPLIK